MEFRDFLFFVVNNNKINEEKKDQKQIWMVSKEKQTLSSRGGAVWGSMKGGEQ